MSKFDAKNFNSTNMSEDEIYEKIMNEIDNDQKVKSLWAKAFAESDGDENKAKALYIKLRLQSISNENIKKTPEKRNKFTFIITVIIGIVVFGILYILNIKDSNNDSKSISTSSKKEIILDDKFNIKELKGVTNLNDDYNTSCEKLKLLSPNDYGRDYYGERFGSCSINNGNIKLLTYDEKRVDGFGTSFEYNKFINMSVEDIKTYFKKIGYKEFTKTDNWNEWVSTREGQNYVLIISEYGYINFIATDKYIEMEVNKESKRIKKVKNYVLDLNKSITIGDAFDNFSDCENPEWKELMTSNNAELVEFNCDIISERKFFNENILKIKANSLKIDPIISTVFLTQGISLEELNANKPFMDVSNFKMIAQFIINKDNTIEVAYLSEKTLWKNGKEYEPSVSQEYINNTLKNIIYKNKDFFKVENLEELNQLKQALSFYGVKNKAFDDLNIILYFKGLESFYSEAKTIINDIPSYINENANSNQTVIKEFNNNGIKLIIEMPSSIKPDDKVNIKISMTNEINIGKSKGGITVGFPQLENIVLLNNHSTLDIKNYSKNNKVWSNIDKKQILSSYFMQEGWSNDWNSNTTKEINFSFDAKQLNFMMLPDLKLEVRSILINNKNEFLNPNDGEMSQQGYKTFKFNIPIEIK